MRLGRGEGQKLTQGNRKEVLQDDIENKLAAKNHKDNNNHNKKKAGNAAFTVVMHSYVYVRRGGDNPQAYTLYNILCRCLRRLI